MDRFKELRKFFLLLRHLQVHKMSIVVLLLFLLVGCKTTSSNISHDESETKSVSTESGTKTTESDTQTTIKKTVTQDPSKITEKDEEFLIIPVPGKAPVSVLKKRYVKVTELGKKVTDEEIERQRLVKLQEEEQKQREIDAKKKKDLEIKKTMTPSLGCALGGSVWVVVILLAIVGIAIPILRKFANVLPFPFNLLGKKE